MSKSRRWGRRTSAALLSSAVALAAVTLSGGGTASADPSDGSDTIKGAPADKLGQHDTDLLADAEARHEPTVMLIVATDKGRAGAVAAELRKLGGKVAKQVDGVGYVLSLIHI